MRIIHLSPKGEPDPYCQWSNPRPKAIQVTTEDENYWWGNPVDNPACPTLQFPKFAWEERKPYEKHHHES